MASQKYREYIRILWLLAIFALLMITMLFVYIAKTKLPDTASLENPDLELATEILADDGRVLGKAFKKNRAWISYEEINPFLVNALVSTEDERYFSHNGIDLRSTARAVVFLGSKGGASTITQQLAKQFFTDRSSNFGRRVWQKLREWVIAIEFEKRYTKEEIVAMYLNKFDFYYNANGVSAAAETYFGKNQKDLTVDEAATLIGMLKNPNLYNPNKRPDNAIKRRNTVMRQMVRNNKLSQESYEAFSALPMDMGRFQREENFSGLAPYFRASLLEDVKRLLKNPKYQKADGTSYDIYTDGMKIYTTIDIDMQRHAEAVMKQHMSKIQSTFFGVWKGKDPWTYKADRKQKKIRQGNLNHQIESSQRYKLLRSKYLSKVNHSIMKEIPKARLWEGDINRMLSAEKDKNYLKKLVKNKTIRADQKSTYEKVMASPHFSTLKRQVAALDKVVQRVFKTKTKMKVFAYNDKGSKTVVMTPLDSIRYHNMHLQLGSLALDPRTGHVKTWVGGIGHEYFKYDHIRSNRQVGSTFKPFIYTTAISDLAMSPCQTVQDIQYTIVAGDPDFKLSKSWSPANANNKFTGQYMTLKEGLKQSKNSVSVKLMKEIGNVQRVKNFTANLGIPKSKVPDYPSICLGTPELSVLEMAGAYTAFANDGNYVKPVFIEKIVDGNGKTVYSGESEKKKAINSSYNYVMVDMLKNAASFVSGQLKSEFGGKTGTTDDYKNGWFVGITPQLVVTTWVGGDQEWIRFLRIQEGQGAVMARPYCVEFIKSLENDPRVRYSTNARFKVPENLNVELDCNTYDQMKKADIERERLEKEKEVIDEISDDELDEDF